MRLAPFALLSLLLAPLVSRAADSHLLLFLDPGFVRESQGATLRINPPTSREIVMHPDQPWESMMITFYTTAFADAGKIRLWYICRDKADHPNVAYAESADGVHFTKPELGIVNYEGSTANNLVGLTPLEGTVFRDPHATAPDHAYTYLTPIWTEGFVRFYSPDGLHWQRDPKPLFAFGADNQAVTFWDTRLSKYVLYMRGWTRQPDQKLYRCVMRTTLPDLTTPVNVVPDEKSLYLWGKEKTPLLNTQFPKVLAADDQDPPDTDVYTIAAQPYPGDPQWYIGFPSFFQHEGHVSKGRLEVEFIGSRDGEKWERYSRAPYIACGLPGEPNENMVFVGPGVIEHGDEFWQYGTGFRSKHGDKTRAERDPDGVIYRYIQRRDGFVSLDFDSTPGHAVTQAVTVNGAQLSVNLDPGVLGQIRIGLRDEQGNPIPGFDVADADPLRVNSLRASATWKGQASLAPLAGNKVQLEIQGHSAKLYSLHFEAPAK